MNSIALATLLQQPFCISKDLENAMLPVVASILLGKSLHTNIDYSAERLENTPKFISSNGSVVTSWDVSTAPQSSVMVLNLKGTILKESQHCGPSGTVELALRVNAAKDNANIIGAVMVVESGGGAVYAVKPLADAISSFKSDKPFLAIADDMMASAAYYIASYCTEIWAINPKSIIGSIGTMCSFTDFKPALEKMGVVSHEIYATESTAKNKDFKDAEKGNYDALRTKQLDPLNEDFINAIKTNREGVISTSENLIYKGETYFATVAQALGMIDNIGSLNEAIARVRELAVNPSENLTPQNKTMKNITALAGNTAPDQTAMDLANADLTAAGITNVTLVQESFITKAASVTQKNTVLTAKLASLETANTEAVAQLAAAQTKIVSLEEKVEAFGANAGALHSGKIADVDKEEKPDATATELQAIIDAMPHNKMADKFI